VVDVPSSLAANLFGDGGRSAALAGNPVHLAALAVLGLALIIPRFASARAAWALPVAATAAAVQLSGTRLAIVVMAAMVLWAARRHGVLLGALLGLLVVVGLAAGAAIGPSGGSATSRAAGPALSGSWGPRVDTWLSARHAVVERPLVGIGPGQFRTATSPYRSVAVATREGPDRLFTDAHNLFIEYAVTTGLFGVGALIVWLVAATRRGRGWLLVAALGVLALHLFEPQAVATTPLAFLALGASAAGDLAPERRTGRAGRAIGGIVPTVSILAAIAVAAVFLAGEFDLQQGQLDLRTGPAQQANGLLPAWPRTASLLAQVWLFNGIVDHHNQADYQVSRAWRLAAVQRDKADPVLWNVLAEFDETSGRISDARLEYLAALRVNPTSARAMDGLARLAHQACDVAAEADWRAKALRVSLPGTPQPGAPRQRVEAAPVCPGLAGN
jgi:O-antigen ligase